MKAKINPQRRAIGGLAHGVAEKMSKRKKRAFDIGCKDCSGSVQEAGDFVV
jgi:hypothetical protein